MKVLFDARYLNNPSSGISVYCQNVIQCLLRASPTLRLTLVTRKRGLAEQFQSQHCDELLFRFPPRSFSTLFALSKLLPTERFDLFHSPFNIIPSGLKCRSVVTIHDIMQLQDPANIATSSFVQHTAGRFWRTRIRHAAAHSTHIAAVSGATRSALLEHFPALTGAQISVTPNGVDTTFFEPPSSAAVRAARQLVGQERFVLCVGNESPHKNHERAIQSFLLAFADDPSIRFVLVRRSVRRDPAMVALLNDPRIAKRVQLLEHTDFKVLQALYHEAHLFFFPSWVEGFGIPIVEAMASGTPVLTSDRSAPAEVAGNAALQANPFDLDEMASALRQLDSDAQLRATLIEAGRARAAEFTWRRCAKATLEAYKTAMSRPLERP